MRMPCMPPRHTERVRNTHESERNHGSNVVRQTEVHTGLLAPKNLTHLFCGSPLTAGDIIQFHTTISNLLPHVKESELLFLIAFLQYLMLGL